MRRNPCDIYIYVYLVNPIIFFSNSELNQMCDVGWTRMLRTQPVCFFPFDPDESGAHYRSVPAAGGPQAAQKPEFSQSVVICSRTRSPFRPSFVLYGLRATSASDSASPDGDDLSEVQLVIVHLGDKDGRHGLVERGAVHVDRGADRQHEADDAPVDVVVLQEALEGDRQRGRTAEGEHVAHMCTTQPDPEGPGRPGTRTPKALSRLSGRDRTSTKTTAFGT